MKLKTKRTISKAVMMAALFCMTTQTTFAALINLAQQPLFTGSSIPPKVMLTISKDQQLYKKAYNDYTDLDGDGQLETTYKHAIDYYGYFDPKKCYEYKNQRFEPKKMADATKYCTTGAAEWSGNFLNWVSMSRMDAVRKLLYGGLRSTDQTFASGGVNAETVLERAYLPTDAHAWAKHYNGADIASLTPFNPPSVATPFLALTSSSFTIPAADGDYVIPFQSSQNSRIALGDQIRVQRTASPGNFFIGAVLAMNGTGQTVTVRVNMAGVGGAGSDTSWTVTNLSRTGISFCNLTKGAATGLDQRSSTNTQPPLIRVVQGNFGLWNANERWQCQWFEERNNFQGGFPGGLLSNGNQASLSEINSSAENPSQVTHGLGTGITQGEYIVRVKACDRQFIGTERCKQYPNGNYKPIGLLQQYGDQEQIHFGLMTGSHAKNISGGVLRKSVGAISDEVRVNSDGTFLQPNTPPNAPRTASSTATPAGIINTLNYMRLYGYLYSDGTYIGASGDNCTYQLTSIVENNCTSWGNPMSEVFFESIRYFAGKSATPAYTYTVSGSKDNELGLPLATWTDPISSTLYCAPLNVVVFNASVSSNDDDLRGTSGSAINATSTIAGLTNVVGSAEGITNGNYFAGKLVGTPATPNTDPGFELCTSKTITGLGDVSGICPEGPTVAGSYLMGGIAHHAHTQRIRADITVPSNDPKSLKVTTYGIQLATNVPTLTIPVPGAAKNVVIQPIYRLDLGAGNYGGGALVDMRFVRQQTVGNVTTGKVYVNWEDSEQGGDYDQDMWGTIEWVLDAGANTIKVTTNAISASTTNPQGFGYAISGTTRDGAHFHSGIYGFNFVDPTGVVAQPANVAGCSNCNLSAAGAGQRGPQTVTYSLGATTGNTLKDPLWYAAKYGAFVDQNGDGLPDSASEWDTKLASGLSGTDGVPDNYFLVTNPLGLEAALDRAFRNILQTASATSVAANSTQLQTTSAIYQARFNTSDWSGQLLSSGVNPDATINATPNWDAGAVINTQTPGSRTILTLNDTAGVRTGVPFRWPVNPLSPLASEISLNLVTNLNVNPDTNVADTRGSDRLAYLRGDSAFETGAGAIFRLRPTSKLGDIINSNPAYVGAPNALVLEPAYATFRQTNLSRTPMIYAGANDGMLHGIDANTGQEKLAYIPTKTFQNLNDLTSPNYVHRYYVDGSPEVADAVVNGQWKTVLVGGLAGGGQGLYALDVTNPSAFSEANAASTVMWEFNDSDDKDLGFTYGKPVIRKMANGRWAAIVAGGYNNTDVSDTSTTGRAFLFILFLQGPTGAGRTWIQGTDYVKIDTGVGAIATPNSLAPPFPADTNVDGMVDFVYAGDLRGNFWKFDLSSTSTATWTLASSKVLLFQAKDANGNAQPITGQAEGTLHPTGKGYVLTFGTGKYLESADTIAPYVANSFYGIWDKNDLPGNIVNQTTVTARNQLLVQTISDVTVGTNTFRVVSNNAPVWSNDTSPPTAGDSPPNDMGWLIDFPNSTTTGERSVSRPLLLNSRLIFTTLIPSGGACSFGGSSFLMIVDPTTGARIDGAVLDTDGNGQLNAQDQITSGTTLVYASGVQSTAGISPTPTIVTGGSSSGVPAVSQILGTTGSLQAGTSLLTAYAIGGNSAGGTSVNLIGLSSSSGRVSWREVLTR